MPLVFKNLFLAALLSSGVSAHAQQPKETLEESTKVATELAGKMLERLGGREAWAKLNNTINGSIQNRAVEPTEVYSVITMDFESPRFKIETIGPDIYLVRVINGEQSWRISWAGEVEDLPAANFEADMLWYQAHIYKTIHRLAKEDDQLSLQVRDDRLEVFEAGARLLWFKLDAKAAPYAFGFRDDDIGSLSGPWSIIHHPSGVHHPRWVSHADGTWRAAIQNVEFNVPLHTTLFARPRETGN